jgi:hypothetical protein
LEAPVGKGIPVVDTVTDFEKLGIRFNTHLGNCKKRIINPPLRRSPATELDLYEGHTILNRAANFCRGRDIRGGSQVGSLNSREEWALRPLSF